MTFFKFLFLFFYLHAVFWKQFNFYHRITLAQNLMNTETFWKTSWKHHGEFSFMNWSFPLSMAVNTSLYVRNKIDEYCLGVQGHANWLKFWAILYLELSYWCSRTEKITWLVNNIFTLPSDFTQFKPFHEYFELFTLPTCHDPI